MTFNKIKMPTKRSGRNIHRFLIKEAYRIFSDRGYDVDIEVSMSDSPKSIIKYKADVLATKGKKRIVVECLSRPTLNVCKDKQKYRKHCDALILVYPSDFIPVFPTENFFDESIQIDIPDKIKRTVTTLLISPSTRRRLNLTKYKLGYDTIDETINKIFDIVEKISEAK